MKKKTTAVKAVEVKEEYIVLEKKKIKEYKSEFDKAAHFVDDINVEYWYARELMPLLGYEQWRNFENAINKAMISCEASGIAVSDHFADVSKMIPMKDNKKPPSGDRRKQKGAVP